MSKTYTYTLRIVAPETMEDYVRTAIETAREPQDVTFDAAVRRYLGDYLSDAENALSSELPEGWYAKVDDARTC